MLVLSRNVGESIEIAGGITITINRVSRGKVRLGIEAPKEIKVLRTELETKENSDGRANGDSVRWVDAGDRGSDLVGPDARG